MHALGKGFDLIQWNHQLQSSRNSAATKSNRTLLRKSGFRAHTLGLVALLVLSLAFASTAAAQSAQFQNSTLSGSGNSINVTQIPVLTSTGFVYWNMIIQFSVASNGTLTIATGYPKFMKATEPIINGFKAGTYLGPDQGDELITVNGPGVAPSGVTAWSLGPASGSGGCLVPNTAAWYDVGTTLTNNPLYPRLKNAGITSTMLQYGTGVANCGGGQTWESNSLLGFSQTNGALTITSFTKNGTDYNTAQDQKTYQLHP